VKVHDCFRINLAAVKLFPKPMKESTDRLYSLRIASRQIYFDDQGKNIPKSDVRCIIASS